MKLERMRDIVARLKTDDTQRALNRAAIDRLFDGEAPFTEKEAIDNHFYTNVQPLMAPRIAQQARQQLSRATMRGRIRFSVDVDLGDMNLAKFVSGEITRLINLPIVRSKAYRTVCFGVDATLFLHGRGPVIWDDTHRWLPRTLGLEDFKVPSSTFTDFSNLSHFAVYQEISVAELYRKISGKFVDPGWRVERVKRLLDDLTKEIVKSERTTDETYFPEKVAQTVKEDGAFWASDKVPTARCWWFFELEEVDGRMGWKRYLFSDESDARLRELGDQDDFLFKDESGKIGDIHQIVQVQYADGCNKAPFRYHSVRGPGYLLYPVMQLLNRLFCRSNDAIFEACNQLFRNVGESDREKLMQVVLSNMSIMPNGVDYVPANERYTVNHNLLKFGMDMMRQYVSENAAAFTAETESGTQKEMTATQVMARVQEAAQLVQGIVATKADYQADQYEEIARRFTITNSRDADVRAFRESALALGLPKEALDFDRWTVRGETALGGGNKVLEMASATELMRARAAFNPQAQQTILRRYATAVLDDAQDAYELVPMEPQGPSKTSMFANIAVGTLLQSVPVQLEEWIILDEYAMILVGLLQTKIAGLVQAQVQPSAETVGGIMFTAQHIEAVIQQIGADEAKQPFAKMLMERLKQIMQPVDGWMAALQQAQAQGSPELQAKIQAMLVEAQSRAQISQASAAQKRSNLEDRHQFKMMADRVNLAADLERKDLETAQDLAHSSAEFSQEARQEAIKSAMEAGKMARKGMKESKNGGNGRSK